jgi:hypothetical protein
LPAKRLIDRRFAESQPLKCRVDFDRRIQRIARSNFHIVQRFSPDMNRAVGSTAISILIKPPLTFSWRGSPTSDKLESDYSGSASNLRRTPPIWIFI